MNHPDDMFDSHAQSGPLTVTDDRYSAFSYDDQLVIYDPSDAECWLESNTTIDLSWAV